MVFPSPGRRDRNPARSRKTGRPEDESARYDLELEEIRRQETVLRRKQQEIERRAAELPKKLEEKKRREEELIKLRAVASVTLSDGIVRPRLKRGNSPKGRMTVPEHRSARIQFLMLCAVLLAILVLLWKSLP